MIKIKSKWIKIVLLVLVVAAAAAAKPFYDGYSEYRKNAVPVLEYHSVGGSDEWPAEVIIKTEVFEKQLQYLHNNGYRMLSMEQMIDGFKNGKDMGKAVVLTFDDGYMDNYTNVFPLLKNPKYFAWELSSSKFFLKKEFDMYYVHLLSYPNGKYDEKVIAAAQKYGYNYAVTGKNGAVDKNWVENHPMEIGRVIIKGDMTESEFKSKLERSYLLGYLKSVVFGSLFFY